MRSVLLTISKSSQTHGTRGSTFCFFPVAFPGTQSFPGRLFPSVSNRLVLFAFDLCSPFCWLVPHKAHRSAYFKRLVNQNHPTAYMRGFQSAGFHAESDFKIAKGHDFFDAFRHTRTLHIHFSIVAFNLAFTFGPFCILPIKRKGRVSCHST